MFGHGNGWPWKEISVKSRLAVSLRHVTMQSVVHFRRKMEVDVGGGETAILRGAIPSEQVTHGTEPRLPI